MEGLELGVEETPGPQLRQAVADLVRRVEAVTGFPALSERKQMELARNSWEDRAGGSVGITARAAPGAGLVGYAQVVDDGPQGRYALEITVDPDAPGAGGVAEALLAAATDRVATLGGGSVRLWVSGASATDDARAAEHGFRLERELLQMRCPLPLPPPRVDEVVVATRPFRPGQDEEAWLTTNNRAFDSHAEQGHWELATLLEREGQAWFDPDGFRVLEVDGRIAASCWTKVHADHDPPLGEIYVISVEPEFHGRGWGRALTRAGLDWLASQGLTVGMLYVDAANAAAVGLYRSMGFVRHHVDRSYVRTVPGA
ncbi:MAG TPA: mycothiol synthase [Acidimicrobiales bacterium]|jgi:mycothiol synthase|nr:mycothiol synthase [Acidimicrobiales bacterium]